MPRVVTGSAHTRALVWCIHYCIDNNTSSSSSSSSSWQSAHFCKQKRRPTGKVNGKSNEIKRQQTTQKTWICSIALHALNCVIATGFFCASYVCTPIMRDPCCYVRAASGIILRKIEIESNTFWWGDVGRCLPRFAFVRALTKPVGVLLHRNRTMNIISIVLLFYTHTLGPILLQSSNVSEIPIGHGWCWLMCGGGGCCPFPDTGRSAKERRKLPPIIVSALLGFWFCLHTDRHT